MAETTIEWTASPRADGTMAPGYTHNPWWGCTRVSPGCERCYAETFAKRVGLKVWGPTSGGVERRFFGLEYHAKPFKWDAKARSLGERHRVFCASMCDVFEEGSGDVGIMMGAERVRLWQTIAATPNLDWLVLTKRPQNIMGMVPTAWRDGLPANVWIGTTAEDQQRFDERWAHLRLVPARVRFFSMEPLLGPIDARRAMWPMLAHWPAGYGSPEEALAAGGDVQYRRQGLVSAHAVFIDWVIVGGESGGKARPMQLEWARSLRDQCVAAGVPFHFKQWGEYNDGLIRLGKKKAGRLLDGREWNGFPEVRP